MFKRMICALYIICSHRLSAVALELLTRMHHVPRTIVYKGQLTPEQVSTSA
jgi:hypothetical protein